METLYKLQFTEAAHVEGGVIFTAKYYIKLVFDV